MRVAKSDAVQIIAHPKSRQWQASCKIKAIVATCKLDRACVSQNRFGHPDPDKTSHMRFSFCLRVVVVVCWVLWLYVGDNHKSHLQIQQLLSKHAFESCGVSRYSYAYLFFKRFRVSVHTNRAAYRGICIPTTSSQCTFESCGMSRYSRVNCVFKWLVMSNVACVRLRSSKIIV